VTIDDLGDRDPLELDLLEVDDPLTPEESALHLEPLDGEWIEGRDLTPDEMVTAHEAEVRRIDTYLAAGGDGSALR
jgi:hypothetical protein